MVILGGLKWKSYSFDSAKIWSSVLAQPRRILFEIPACSMLIRPRKELLWEWCNGQRRDPRGEIEVDVS